MSENLDTLVHGGRVRRPSTIGGGVAGDIGVLDGRSVALRDLSRRVARELRPAPAPRLSGGSAAGP